MILRFGRLNPQPVITDDDLFGGTGEPIAGQEQPDGKDHRERGGEMQL
jgi:hypothetical protein